MREWEDRWEIRTPLPPTEAEVTAFNDWLERWEATETEGELRGWLQGGHYEPHWTTGPQPSGFDVRLETDEEYAARQADSIHKVQHDINKAVMKQYEAILKTESVVFKGKEDDGRYATFPVHHRSSSEKPVIPGGCDRE